MQGTKRESDRPILLESEARVFERLIRRVMKCLAMFFALLPWGVFLLLAWEGILGARWSAAPGAFWLLSMSAGAFCAADQWTRTTLRFWQDFPYWPEDEPFVQKSVTSFALLLIGCLLLSQEPLSRFLLYGIVILLLNFVWQIMSVRLAEHWVRPLREQLAFYQEKQLPLSLKISEETIETISKREFLPDVSAEGEHLLQYQMRTLLEDGREAVEGMIRIRFAPHERQGTAHLSFCPPFDSVPTIEFEMESDSDIDSRITQIQSFGARIEMKRNASSSSSLLPEEIVLLRYFVACSSGK